MPVKDNQSRLLADIQAWFEHPSAVHGLDRRQAQQITKGHGRLEVRYLSASTELNGYLDFLAVQQVLRLERRITRLKTGEVTWEVAYALTSLSPQQANAAQFSAVAATLGH